MSITPEEDSISDPRPLHSYSPRDADPVLGLPPPHQVLFVSEFVCLMFLSEKGIVRQELPLAWMAEDCIILGQ